MTPLLSFATGHRLTNAAIIAATSVAVLVLTIVLSPAPSVAAAVVPGVFWQWREASGSILIAAHRGDRGRAPENTIEALGAALSTGAQLVETDVQLTADGVPVLLHDFSLDRTTSGSGPIWGATAAEIATLDAGSWHSSDHARATVPRLSEFLAMLAPTSADAILELKGPWVEAGLALVVSQLRAEQLTERVMLASFDAVTLSELASIAPEIGRIVIVREPQGDPARLAAFCDATVVAIGVDYLSEYQEVVDELHSAGLGVLSYTLNAEVEWKIATQLGLDGIITDAPGALMDWIAAESD